MYHLPRAKSPLLLRKTMIPGSPYVPLFPAHYTMAWRTTSALSAGGSGARVCQYRVCRRCGGGGGMSGEVDRRGMGMGIKHLVLVPRQNSDMQ
jgi:hypothetical protein